MENYEQLQEATEEEPTGWIGPWGWWFKLVNDPTACVTAVLAALTFAYVVIISVPPAASGTSD